MNLATLTIIVVSSVGALLAGMAALLKGMVLSRLDHLQETLTGLHRDHHRLDARVIKLETEHALHACCRMADRTNPGTHDSR